MREGKINHEGHEGHKETFSSLCSLWPLWLKTEVCMERNTRERKISRAKARAPAVAGLAKKWNLAPWRLCSRLASLRVFFSPLVFLSRELSPVIGKAVTLQACLITAKSLRMTPAVLFSRPEMRRSSAGGRWLMARGRAINGGVRRANGSFILTRAGGKRAGENLARREHTPARQVYIVARHEQTPPRAEDSFAREKHSSLRQKHTSLPCEEPARRGTAAADCDGKSGCSGLGQFHREPLRANRKMKGAESWGASFQFSVFSFQDAVFTH